MPEVWVPVLYAVLAAVWIYFSDYVVVLLAATTAQVRIWSTLKGWLFVAFTAGLLVLLLRRIFERMRAAGRELEASREDLKTWSQTLEQRVKERTALAEHRANQLRALALELVRTEQQERRRVAHTLHESFQQLLVAAKFNLSLLERHPERPMMLPLRSINEAIDEAIRVSRLLTVELSPPILYEVGLLQALRWLGHWMQERHSLHVEILLSQAVTEPDEEDMRVMLFHAVRELLLNVVKHAQVRSARMDVTCRDGRMCVVVSDDGIGFDPQHRPERRDVVAGYGLFSIRERLTQVGGHMEIISAPGCGTRVSLVVPLCCQPATA